MSSRRNSLCCILSAWLYVSLLFLAACQQQLAVSPAAAKKTADPPEAALPSEVTPIRIPLAGPAASPEAELSGLAWVGDTLLLLPQYPERFQGGSEGALLAIPMSAILDFLDGKSNSPITPRQVPFNAPGVKAKLGGYEGYESVVVNDDRIYFTVESHTLGGMQAVLVSGTIESNLTSVRLDNTRMEFIPAQAAIPNFSDEAMTLFGSRLATFYEANGVKANPTPVVHLFDLALGPQGVIFAPKIEYRITDATAAYDDGRFWVINYFFPGDTKILPERDTLAEQYGKGATHRQSQAVERLVELQWQANRISLTNRPPVQLSLQPNNTARNWEGIAILPGRGFLLVTDQHPETILAFIPYEFRQ